jgi:RHS repeat-associated protein
VKNTGHGEAVLMENTTNLLFRAKLNELQGTAITEEVSGLTAYLSVANAYTSDYHWHHELTETYCAPPNVGVLCTSNYSRQGRYRYGYQGQFAERDEETGWNHFELREYDAASIRWLIPDPMRQYPSPYVAFGNSPIIKVDPDGGCDDPPCDQSGGLIGMIRDFFASWGDQFTFDFSRDELLTTSNDGNTESMEQLSQLSNANRTVYLLSTVRPYYSIQIGKQAGYGKPAPYFEATFTNGQVYYGLGADYTVSTPGLPSIGFSHGLTWGDPSGFDYGGTAGICGIGYEYGRSFDGSGGKFGFTFSSAGNWVGVNASYSNTFSGYFNIARQISR